MKLLVNTLKVIHWHDLDIEMDDLHLVSSKVSWGDASYTLIPVRDVMNALGKEMDKPGFRQAFSALSEHDTDDVFVALPG